MPQGRDGYSKRSGFVFHDQSADRVFRRIPVKNVNGIGGIGAEGEGGRY